VGRNLTKWLIEYLAMPKKIVFIPSNDFIDKIDSPRPAPASEYMPKWYKNLNLHVFPDLKSHRMTDGGANLTIKACMPVLDAITSGYTIPLPCDLTFVDPNIYGHRVTWEVPWTPVTEHHEGQTTGIGLSNDYEKMALKFEIPWRAIAPKGYSLLYTHPFYHFELPFISTTAIVDSDVFTREINIPFFIKKDFMGILPMGTPIVQIIPIKRDSWKSSFQKYDPDYALSITNLKLVAFKSYVKRWWVKKSYK
jgi:hypothetical protein